MEIDGAIVAAVLAVVAIAGVVLLLLLVKMLSTGKMQIQPPGPLTIGEVKSHLGAYGLSLAEKRRLALMFDGQRVRWPCTFGEIYQTRSAMTARCVGEPNGGQFFFDPSQADCKVMEQIREGARMVVEGTLRVDLNHDLLTLDAPLVFFDQR